MITTLIFSKDRACQLDLLLRSIHKHLTCFPLDDIFVLYTASNNNFEQAYNRVWQAFPAVKKIWQLDFNQDTHSILRLAKKYICFFVDDNIIYRYCSWSAKHNDVLFESVKHMGCLSLRLGLNTVVQNQYASPPTKIEINHPISQVNFDQFKMMAWNWSVLQPNNFGYAFSVDGHIYQTEIIRKALDFEFDTPNALEGRFNVAYIPIVMACFKQSVLVNNPLNLVGSSNNAAGVYYGHTLENLNEQYLSGKQIDLESLCQNEIVGCHQEMEIKFV